jgi:hypothetical protein
VELLNFTYGLGLICDGFVPWFFSSKDFPTSHRLRLHLLGPRLKLLPQGVGQIWYSGKADEADGLPAVQVVRFEAAGRRYFRLCYLDHSEFVVDAGATEIWAAWPDGVTTEDALTYLAGPVLGFALRLRGIAALHASVVAIDGRAIILVGSAGIGKSTTAAALAILGYPVLSEDIAALDDQGDHFFVQPGYPHVNLWPSSVELLFGAADALPRICPLHPTWDKRYLNLTTPPYRFQDRALPLGAVYVLGDRTDDQATIDIEPLAGTEAMIAMVANTYANYLLGKQMRAREFEVLGRLLRHVPVRKVSPPANPHRIWDLCQVLVEDFRELPADNTPLLTTKDVHTHA